MTDELASIAAGLNAAIHTVAPWASYSAIVHVVRGDDSVDAPAWYQSSSGEITIDLATASDLTDIEIKRSLLDSGRGGRGGRRDLFRHDNIRPILGLLQHEASHSKWSKWLTKVETTDEIAATLTLFEEIRIEKRAVDRGKALARRGLRSSASHLLQTDTLFASTQGAASSLVLVMGRVKAGILDYEEVAEIDPLIRLILGEDTTEDLTDILDEVIILEPHYPDQLTRLIELATLWNEIVGDDGDEEGSGKGSGCKDRSGDKGKGKGKGKGDEDTEDETETETGGGGGEVDSDEEEEDEDDTSEDDTTEDEDDEDDSGSGDEDDEAAELPTVGEPGGAPLEREEEESKAVDAAIGDLLEAAIKSMVETVGLDWNKKVPVTLAKPYPTAKTVFAPRRSLAKNRKWTVQPPNKKERLAARQLARELETLSVPVVTTTIAMEDLPPGRLRTREAVRASAERAQGRMVTGRPWKTKKRQHAAVPPMTIGIMTDTSGSMKWAEEMVASTAYIFSHAGQRINAKTAAVTFGNRAEAVIHPNEAPDEVRIREADGGEEAFDEAIAALDGVLHFTSGRPGAKLLVVVSDGHLVRDGEMQRAEMWMQKLKRSGVSVVWANLDGYGRYPSGDLVRLPLTSSRWGHGPRIEPEILVTEMVSAIKKAMTRQ